MGHCVMETPTLNHSQAVFQLSSIPKRRARWQIPCLSRTREADDSLWQLLPRLAVLLHPWDDHRVKWNLAYVIQMETFKVTQGAFPLQYRVMCLWEPYEKSICLLLPRFSRCSPSLALSHKASCLPQGTVPSASSEFLCPCWSLYFLFSVPNHLSVCFVVCLKKLRISWGQVLNLYLFVISTCTY